jgi:hypothetical protein
VKHSSTLNWTRLTHAAAGDIASGDMNGDGRDDLVGNWSTGVYYKNSIGGAWVKMGPTGELIAAGDLDGDGIDDLIWSKTGDGVWVKQSSTLNWTRLTPAAATHMDAGLLRGGANPWPEAAIGRFTELQVSLGEYIEGPGSVSDCVDLSDEGPGGWNFVFSEQENLVPQEKDSVDIMRIPGPGEPGFRCIEQKNIVPQEEKKSKIKYNR